MSDTQNPAPVAIEFPIKWGEMDAFQHLNNTVYFRYFEDARIAYFERVEVGRVKTESGIGPILASTTCDFRIPLTYPDTVTVSARVTDLQPDRFSMAYEVFSHQHQKVAAKGSGLLMAFDYENGKRAEFPSSLRSRIAELDKLPQDLG